MNIVKYRVMGKYRVLFVFFKEKKSLTDEELKIDTRTESITGEGKK